MIIFQRAKDTEARHNKQPYDIMDFKKRLFVGLLFTLTAALTVTAAPRSKAAIKAIAAKVFKQSPTLMTTRASKDEPRALLANKAFTVMGYDNGGSSVTMTFCLMSSPIQTRFSTRTQTTRTSNGTSRQRKRLSKTL